MLSKLKSSITTFVNSNLLTLQTDPIIVSSQPYSLMFTKQPPWQVQVGYLFQVVVTCKGRSMRGLSNQKVLINIIPQTTGS